MAKAMTAVQSVSNGAKAQLEDLTTYTVEITIQGVADLLFHAWNVESIEAKSQAAKGSKAKKTDDVESYVYRNEEGELCIPGEYLRMAIVNAGRSFQDPRSPRKSMSDLLKAAVFPETELASLGVKTWDKLDRRRVQVQRNGLTRTRPAMEKGWTATFRMTVSIPEHVSPEKLLELLNEAGRRVGIGDFRPSFGRFNVTKFERIELL